MTERPNDINGSENSPQTPTLAQRLRQNTPDVLKDFAGLSTRLAIYATTAVLAEAGATVAGWDKSTALAIGFAALTINMAIGEGFYMRRLSRFMPLFRADRTGWWDNKRNS